MVKIHPKTLEKRWHVVNLYNRGIRKPSQIKRQTGADYNFIRRWIDRYKRTGGVDDLPRAGRPRSLQAPQLVFLKTALRHPARSASSRAVSVAMTRQGHPTSHQTVLRRAKEAGLVYRLRRKKPNLRQFHKKARLQFAERSFPRVFWKHCLFADESSFALYSDPRGQWVFQGQAATPRRTEKYAPRIRVWAGVCWWGKTSLLRIPTSMTGSQFAEFLRTQAIPEMNRLMAPCRKRWKLVQDGDGTHQAKIALKTLADARINLIEHWPSRSPDLNIQENLWGMLQHELEKYSPRTRDGLWTALKKAWDSIPTENIRKCIQSMPDRLTAVRASRGGTTKY